MVPVERDPDAIHRTGTLVFQTARSKCSFGANWKTWRQEARLNTMDQLIDIMTFKADDRPGRFMPGLFWLSLAVIAGFAVVVEIVVSLPFSFTHGWAVGWPGVSFQMALAGSVTVFQSLVLMTVAVGAGAIGLFICAMFGVRERRQVQIYITWLSIAAIVVLLFSIVTFSNIYNTSDPEPPDLRSGQGVNVATARLASAGARLFCQRGSRGVCRCLLE
jgi:amino acid transporter